MDTPSSHPDSGAPAQLRPQPREDAGLLLVGKMIKTLVALSIIGAVGYDAISIISTQYFVRDQAQSAARLGHDTLRDQGSVAAAYASVVSYARSQGDTVVPNSFRTGPGNSVTVQLRRSAHTLAAHVIPPTKAYVTATATGTASDPLP